MAINIRRATKKKVKLRGAFYSLSGGGKTYGCLRLATGLALFEAGAETIADRALMPAFGKPGRIGFIDSEDGDSELYADKFDYDVCVLGAEGNPSKTVEGYIDALDGFRAGGYAVVIIDSLSHAWRELLDDVDEAQRGMKNKWQAWAEATPRQKDFISKIKKFSGHLLMTMRADTAWEIDNNDAGKKEPKRIGLKPEQGKGLEYEFTWLALINPDHTTTVQKDRTGKFQDKTAKLTEELGIELGAWLADGKKPVSDMQREELRKLSVVLGLTPEEKRALPKPDGYDDAETLLEDLRARPPSAPAAKSTGASSNGSTPSGATATTAASTASTPAPNGNGQPATAPPTPPPESTTTTATTTSTSPTSSATTQATPDAGVQQDLRPGPSTPAATVPSAATPAPAISAGGSPAEEGSPTPKSSGSKSGTKPTTEPTTEPAESTKRAAKARGATLTGEVLTFAAAVDSCKNTRQLDETEIAWRERLGLLPREEAKGWCAAYVARTRAKLNGDDVAAMPPDVKEKAEKIDALKGAKPKAA